MIDLLKRLRTMAATGWNPIGDEAADTITALRAENERLKEWNREIALNAREFAVENERLRAALEGYVCTCTGGECAEQAGYRDECGKPARAVLEGKP